MVDPRTPVIVGVGQFTERLGESSYRGLSSVELATAAAQAALRDTGADAAAVARAIDTVAGIRQFEISGRTPTLLGASNNYPRSVANRIGAAPARAVLEPLGGQGPQHLVTEFAGVIASGAAEVVMIFGSENTSSLRYYADRDKPDHSETVEGSLEDRGYGYEGLFTDYTVAHGLIGAPAQYGLLENARRSRVGLSVAEYRRAMGELFAPFTKVAAKNPFSSAPVERTAEELITVTESNRMICDPYPRLLVARDQVNMGAAAVLMSVEAARRLGVPQERWVYLHGHADLVDQPLLDRVQVDYNSASVLAINEALAVAGVGIDDISTFDLYSCFPVPVFNFCDGTGLATDDSRGLTLTGGLPYFGGPGNNYSLHGIAETVSEMRDRPGDFGLIAANGGIMSKYSVGVYSTTPVNWKPDNSAALCREVAARPVVPVTEKADGPATIETYTVRYDWPVRTGIIMGRLDADDSRFLALTEDADLVGLLSDGDPLGARITVRAAEKDNRAVLA
ncbi:acetyl-CoA acetyltransferase [Mycolicibacterium anyangense]|uniref:Acetyl-CoA acetyltransferase n=1 Tax=Mycolicibacterium anyangense TaxID=1431246 RepID=A0A6N4WEH7_9MYCO|nr:acetyl-CoA acetyltransferase [Mycolicibacterium anyangense]BBZ77591.1 acetyl-CoA acetyltransferase [Mycolicibacterium anyangense]